MSRAACPAELVAAARAVGISDELVLEAMNATPRAGFVPADYVTVACRDEPMAALRRPRPDDTRPRHETAGGRLANDRNGPAG